MTIEEIRKNAPNGATHYSLFTDTYYKECLGLVYVWNNSGWFRSIYKTVNGMKHLN